jgi:hypothetical protein
LAWALANWPLGKVLGHVQYLPHDAALWAAQEMAKTPQERREESRWNAPDEPEAHRVNAAQLISIAQGFDIPVG